MLRILDEWGIESEEDRQVALHSVAAMDAAYFEVIAERQESK